MKHIILITLFMLTNASSTLACQPSQHLVMPSAKEIEKNLRLHHLYHLAENSDFADRLEDILIELPTLQAFVQQTLDSYHQKHPEQKPLKAVWLADVLRGVAKN